MGTAWHRHALFTAYAASYRDAQKNAVTELTCICDLHNNTRARFVAHSCAIQTAAIPISKVQGLTCQLIAAPAARGWCGGLRDSCCRGIGVSRIRQRILLAAFAPTRSRVATCNIRHCCDVPALVDSWIYVVKATACAHAGWSCSAKVCIGTHLTCCLI